MRTPATLRSEACPRPRDFRCKETGLVIGCAYVMEVAGGRGGCHLPASFLDTPDTPRGRSSRDRRMRLASSSAVCRSQYRARMMLHCSCHNASAPSRDKASSRRPTTAPTPPTPDDSPDSKIATHVERVTWMRPNMVCVVRGRQHDKIGVRLSEQAGRRLLLPELCTMGHELSPGHASPIRCSVLMHRQLYNEPRPCSRRQTGGCTSSWPGRARPRMEQDWSSWLAFNITHLQSFLWGQLRG